MGSNTAYSTPLLSICIPTYNRADVLNETLASIVNNADFGNEVEVVISDNASTDNTFEICEYYTSRYSNIRYHRNSVNIRDANFITVLELATGEYLRLNNDWGALAPDAISYMLETIRENLPTCKPIFFTANTLYTQWRKQTTPVYCRNLDEYIQVVSTYVTAIFIFGVWRRQLDNIKHPLKYTHLLLNQVDWTYQLLENTDCYIYNRSIYIPNNSMTRCIRKGYNWFQVHLENYYHIMQPYVDKGLVSPHTLLQDKRNLLVHFIPELIYTYIRRNPLWQFDTEGTWARLLKYYKTDYFFWLIMLSLPAYCVKADLARLLPRQLKTFLKKLLK